MPQYHNTTPEFSVNIFDHLDVYELANRFTIPDLRREITSAERRARSQRIILEMPCCLLWGFSYLTIPGYGIRAYQLDTDGIEVSLARLDTDWNSYVSICREAIEAIKATKPAPAQPTSHPQQKPIPVRFIKDANDIVDVMSRYTSVRKAGRRFKASCPLHEDKNPSVTIYPDSQTYWCFSCNKGGDIFDLVQAVENVDFKRAAEILNGGMF